jgi:hypothetical protein
VSIPTHAFVLSIAYTKNGEQFIPVLFSVVVFK